MAKRNKQPFWRRRIEANHFSAAAREHPNPYGNRAQRRQARRMMRIGKRGK